MHVYTSFNPSWKCIKFCIYGGYAYYYSFFLFKNVLLNFLTWMFSKIHKCSSIVNSSTVTINNNFQFKIIFKGKILPSTTYFKSPIPQTSLTYSYIPRKWSCRISACWFITKDFHCCFVCFLDWNKQKMKTYDSVLFLFFFCSTGIWTQGCSITLTKRTSLVLFIFYFEAGLFLVA